MDYLHSEELILLRSLPMEMSAWNPLGEKVLRGTCCGVGYRVSGTHANPLGLKTDCPPEVLWDIMRCWAAEHPSKKPLDPDSYEGMHLS